jgi:N-acetylglutamate synthase-like GNAT family acetyltransferase
MVERERLAYLSNLYVRPSSRGGVGRQLVEKAVGAAAGLDVDYVILWPTPQSRTLYQRHGFAATDAVLCLKSG